MRPDAPLALVLEELEESVLLEDEAEPVAVAAEVESCSVGVAEAGGKVEPAARTSNSWEVANC